MLLTAGTSFAPGYESKPTSLWVRHVRRWRIAMADRGGILTQMAPRLSILKVGGVDLRPDVAEKAGFVAILPASRAAGGGHRAASPDRPRLPVGITWHDDTASDRDTFSQRCADLDTTARNASVIFGNDSRCRHARASMRNHAPATRNRIRVMAFNGFTHSFSQYSC